MKILVLGGTVFLGRALTDAAIAAGHSVTHLNRGKSSAADARVETLNADRTDAGALRAVLAGRHWDAVIDTSGFLPQVVQLSADALRSSTRRYLFVSSISAYGEQGYGEDDRVQPALDPVPDAVVMAQNYGALKGMCEAVAQSVFDDRALIVRAGLIVGPHDPTDRFTYWPVRVARGGRVLAPGRPARTVQFIDVRDLAEWMVRALASNTGGTFNATGPSRPIAMQALLEACREVSGSDAAFEWLDDDTLAAKEVAPWKDMPLWLPDADPHARGFMNVPIERAIAQGLALRPLAATIAATLAWARTRPSGYVWRAGLTAERERVILA